MRRETKINFDKALCNANKAVAELKVKRDSAPTWEEMERLNLMIDSWKTVISWIEVARASIKGE